MWNSTRPKAIMLSKVLLLLLIHSIRLGWCNGNLFKACIEMFIPYKDVFDIRVKVLQVVCAKLAKLQKFLKSCKSHQKVILSLFEDFWCLCACIWCSGEVVVGCLYKITEVAKFIIKFQMLFMHAIGLCWIYLYIIWSCVCQLWVQS